MDFVPESAIGDASAARATMDKMAPEHKSGEQHDVKQTGLNLECASEAGFLVESGMQAMR